MSSPDRLPAHSAWAGSARIALSKLRHRPCVGYRRPATGTACGRNSSLLRATAKNVGLAFDQSGGVVEQTSVHHLARSRVVDGAIADGGGADCDRADIRGAAESHRAVGEAERHRAADCLVPV